MLLDNHVRRLCMVVAACAAVACTNDYDRRVAAASDGMIAAATPCPSPATCSGKMTASAREVSICRPAVDARAYAVGDVIVTKEMREHDALGRIVAQHDGTFDVHFTDDSTFPRGPERIVARVCR